MHGSNVKECINKMRVKRGRVLDDSHFWERIVAIRQF